MADGLWHPEPSASMRCAVARLLRLASAPVLTGHVGIDGDALGSAMALWHGLRRLGKSPILALSEPVPRIYEFLVPAGAAVQLGDAEDAERLLGRCDAAVVLDNNAWSRLGHLEVPLSRSRLPVICIDHHPADRPFCDHHLLDVTAAATGILVRELLEELGVSLDANIATGIWVALVNDTGWFRFDNTDRRVLGLASDLLAAGVDIGHVHRALHENESLATFRLQGRLFERLQMYEEGRLALGSLRLADFEEFGASESDSDALVGQMRRLAGVRLVGFLREESDGRVKLSVRSSRGLSARNVARTFGGGGHEVAAGATFRMDWTSAERAVLAALRAELARAPVAAQSPR